MTQVEVVEPTALQAIQRAEVDSTIATAKNFPRDFEKALERAEAMATLTEAIAEECHFSIPRTEKNGRRVNIQGPSIRFAEILASQWGNLHIAARVLEIGAKEVVAQGVCLDLQTNVKWDSEVRQSIVGRNGKRYSQDVIVTNANAAAAKAQRNAVLKAIPAPLWRPIFQKTLERIGGERTPLAESWQRAVSWFASRDVDEGRLRQALGIKRVADLKQADIQTLRGWRNAIEQDAAVVEEIFGADGEPAAEVQAEPESRPAKKRQPPREVQASEPEPVPDPDPDAEFRAKLWGEWEQLVREHGQVAVDAAGAEGVEPNADSTWEDLETAVRAASDAAQGERE